MQLSSQRLVSNNLGGLLKSVLQQECVHVYRLPVAHLSCKGGAAASGSIDWQLQPCKQRMPDPVPAHGGSHMHLCSSIPGAIGSLCMVVRVATKSFCTRRQM